MADLMVDAEEAKAILQRVQDVLRDEDLLFAAEGLRAVFGVIDEFAALQARVRELEGALEFYADRGHWIADYGCTEHSSKATEDCGEKARAALAKPEVGA